MGVIGSGILTQPPFSYTDRQDFGVSLALAAVTAPDPELEKCSQLGASCLRPTACSLEPVVEEKHLNEEEKSVM